jgi:hypothetical protein
MFLSILRLRQWDLNSLWESRNVWLPIEIDDREGSLEVLWHDIYDLNVYARFTPSSIRILILMDIAGKLENGNRSRAKPTSRRTQSSPGTPTSKKPYVPNSKCIQIPPQQAAILTSKM